MDEYDEDVDPLVGPVADLMAEHNLSSTTTSNTQKPTESIKIPDEKLKLRDCLSFLNLRSLFQELFNYLLDIRWYHHLHKTFPKTDQEIILHHPSLPKLSVLLLIYTILAFTFPILFHIFILFLFILDFVIPLSIYYTWFNCLKTIRMFLHTIQTHQQWLIQIHGFQLIRPTSSLFENQLYQLRRSIFEELQKHFLFSRQIARQYVIPNEQLICSIDLDEFGPLIQSNQLELTQLTNQFDQISINSLLKLSHLQINECIQLIHLHRPKSYWLFHDYTHTLQDSIRTLNKIKQNCSMMIDYTDLDKQSSSKKFLSSYFLLRSNCEQLFEINARDSYDTEPLKRIIQDLKTVVYTLEAVRAKPSTKISEENDENILLKENPPPNITSYHRFDDQIEESMDEILVCHTGKSDDDDLIHSMSGTDDYDQRLLREQTSCLMKELQNAIQGKKQEWNEREQRLLGNFENDVEEIQEELIEEQQQFEKVSPMLETISMLDELKHTFVLNRKKLNIDEDIFGEDAIEDSDDDSNV